MKKLLDAWAVLAWLKGEGEAAAKVQVLLDSAERRNDRLFMNIINVGEVYYRIAKAINEEKAKTVITALRRMPIKIVPSRNPLVMKAATLKANFPISYTDAFAAATAQLYEAVLVTGDQDFKILETNKLLEVEWLPSPHGLHHKS